MGRKSHIPSSICNTHTHMDVCMMTENIHKGTDSGKKGLEMQIYFNKKNIFGAIYQKLDF